MRGLPEGWEQHTTQSAKKWKTPPNNGQGNSNIESSTPSPPPRGEAFEELAVSRRHTCGLREDGTALCWGASDPDYDFGQAKAPQGEQFTAISAGYYHTCALRLDGTALCWGVGPGDETPRGHRVGLARLPLPPRSVSPTLPADRPKPAPCAQTAHPSVGERDTLRGTNPGIRLTVGTGRRCL